MSSKAEPLVGLVWVADFDPTTAGGVAAPLWQFLIRTDNESLYFKSGTANTAWTLLSGGGGGGSLTVTDGTTTVANVSMITIDAASGMFVVDLTGGDAKVGQANSTIQQDGSTIVDGTRVINFIGAVVTASTDPDTGLLRADVSYNARFPQTARYTVTGSEPDLTNITINLTSLGIAQPNTNYNAIVTGGGMAFGVSIDTVQADNTINSIHIVGGPWTADDVLVILIIPYVPV